MSPGACRLIRVASRLRRSASLNRVAMDSTPSSTNKVIPIVAAPPEDAEVFLYAATKKIHPRSVSGLFARWRWGLVFLTQIVFYGLPWLEWGQRQAVLFDLGARRFYLFGIVLYPQDFIYLTGLLVISALSLFLFTAVAGRLWCGYACPQTVYTEIFLWIERRFEGDRMARIRLDEAPMSLNKLWRRGGKHGVWLAVAVWTGFTFVGYFTPVRTLGLEVWTNSLGPWETFWVLFYGFATYGNAGFMREQVCKYMCPYARFQSAMFDKDTLIVTYDEARGEPRGKRSRKADPAALKLGACVDCELCVQVCPTGIDIRKGLQYECIGCGACVAACKNASAMLYVAAKAGQLNSLPQGKVEKTRRTVAMVRQMDKEGFGNCTNQYECEAACPKEISVRWITKLNRDYAFSALHNVFIGGKERTEGVD
eukprot:gene42531-51964_t